MTAFAIGKDHNSRSVGLLWTPSGKRGGPVERAAGDNERFFKRPFVGSALQNNHTSKLKAQTQTSSLKLTSLVCECHSVWLTTLSWLSLPLPQNTDPHPPPFQAPQSIRAAGVLPVARVPLVVAAIESILPRVLFQRHRSLFASQPRWPYR